MGLEYLDGKSAAALGLLESLKKEMFGEAQNGMKQIKDDWEYILRGYLDYKKLGLTAQESFICSLMDSGYLKMKDLTLH